ncbi:MAG: family 1 glycosylhydrolase [Actinomycetota bacterium]
MIASLGVSAVRYPVLWERVVADGEPDWSWSDERIARLRELGVRPIVGLLHHGNGPRGTSLLDPAFPERFARYARSFAERYPDVESYAPINEPLTTARFAGLYGVWYPHARDVGTFARILLAQCRAVALAMREVRAVNPSAELILNDDLGRAHSTPRLAYQAEFENERRWLSFDLVSGMVTPEHPMWDLLDADEETRRWLHELVEEPCPPDVVGIDHYVTSERFLDERVARYPSHHHTSNGRDEYADVEAVRVFGELAGWRGVLSEAWTRYGRTLAVTEAHLGSTREEQLRWLQEVWDISDDLRSEGVDVRAVTVWSTFGSFDWNRLVTAVGNHYEPGPFDVRGPEPRATAVATLMRSLAEGRPFDHPALDAPGWWRRSDRFHYPAVTGPRDRHAPPPVRASRRARSILVVGPPSLLTEALEDVCRIRALPVRVVGDGDSVEELEGIWSVIDAQTPIWVPYAVPPGRLRRPGRDVLAAWAAARGLPLGMISSAAVFGLPDGRAHAESEIPAPLDEAGCLARDRERSVVEAHPDALVIRTGPLFGGGDLGTQPFARILRSSATGTPDAIVTPTYVVDAIDHTLDLLIDGERGVWHLANQGEMPLETWLAHPSAAGVHPGASRLPALRSEHGALLPSLSDAVARWRDTRTGRGPDERDDLAASRD